MNRLGALAVLIDYGGVPRDEWIDWYDTEHIPQRVSLDGWLTGQRWMAVEGTRSLGLYDLDDVSRLDHPDYQAIIGEGATPWTRRLHRLRDRENRPSLRHECEQLLPGDIVAPSDAPYLYLARLNVDGEAESDFNAWYDEEHLPLLAEVPGVICARRFVVRNHDDRHVRYLATYHLEHRDVVQSGPWKDALKTPWTRRVEAALHDVSFDMFWR